MQTELYEQLEAQVAHLGQIQDHIPQKLFIDILIGLIQHADDEMQDPDTSKSCILGQITTVSILLGASPSISEQTKLEAYTLVNHITEWVSGKGELEQLHFSLDKLQHDLSLIIG